jgi:hypothetical protein
VDAGAGAGWYALRLSAFLASVVDNLSNDSATGFLLTLVGVFPWIGVVVTVFDGGDVLPPPNLGLSVGDPFGWELPPLNEGGELFGGELPPLNEGGELFGGELPPLNEGLILGAGEDGLMLGLLPPLNEGLLPPLNEGLLPPENEGRLLPPLNDGRLPPPFWA